MAATSRIMTAWVAMAVGLLAVPAAAQDDLPAPEDAAASCEVIQTPSAHVVRCMMSGLPDGVEVHLLVRPQAGGSRAEWSGSATVGDSDIVEATVGCETSGPTDVQVSARDGAVVHRQEVVLPEDCPSGLTLEQWLRLSALLLVGGAITVVPRVAGRRIATHRRRGTRVSGAGSSRSGVLGSRRVRRPRRPRSRRRR